MIEDCLDRLNGLAVQQGISLTLVPFEESITVYSEEELFGKVLENLLTNAIRYAKTTVMIAVKVEKRQVAIYYTEILLIYFCTVSRPAGQHFQTVL